MNATIAKYIKDRNKLYQRDERSCDKVLCTEIANIYTLLTEKL